MLIADIRTDYIKAALSEEDSHSDPMQQFSKWWDEALASKIGEVNAMTLSTVSTSQKPSSRIVLLKAFETAGFTFFTNYESRKGIEIANNPNVSLVFFWKELERQVRIEGIAKQIDPIDSEAYFKTRPRTSQIGAWASPQSRMIISREALIANERDLEQKFAGMDIPRPTHWGGYIVIPDLIEFWQGRPGRLHDRICYSRTSGQAWNKYRVAP